MKLKLKSIISVILILFVLLFNVNTVYAAGSFNVSGGGSVNKDKTTTITISTSNCAGRFSITSSNSSVASVSSSSVFVDGSSNITITGKSAGTAQITISAEDVTDTDENQVTGSQLVTITVVDPTPAPDTNTGSNSGSTTVPDTNTGSNSDSTSTPDTNTGSGSTSKPDTNTGSNSGSNSNITVTTKSDDATLKNLGITPNDFSGFRKNITTYTHEVPNEVDKVKVYAEVTDSKAKIISGTGTKNLVVGLNNLDVVVRAEDGTEKTYTINLTRKEVEEEPEEETPVVEETIGLSSLTIQGLKLSPAFDSKIYEYNADLKEDLDKLEIKAEGTLENSKIEITGNENLKDGENIITIIVTNDNTEEIATYQIIVNKKVEEIKTVVGSTENKENDSESEAEKEKQSVPKIYLILVAIIIVATIILLLVLRSGNNQQYDEDDFERNVDVDNLDSNNTEYEEFIPQNSNNSFNEQEIEYSNDFNMDNRRDNSTVEKIFGKKGKHS